MLKSRSKLHTHDDGKRDRERDGVRCTVLVGDDIPQTAPQKITPSQMAFLVCGLTAAPRPYLYEHRQSCPGVTQAVLYVPCLIRSTPRWSRLAGNIRALASPFSTLIPDRVVPHTFVQPVDCLMPNPHPGDTNWIPGTSGWREGVTTLPLSCLVPAPGSILGSEPATCPRTPPAGRNFTPASISETGRKSSAGLETPALELLLPVGPLTYHAWV